MATYLHVVDAARAAARGAYCLDGSPPAWWHQPPRGQPAVGANTSWLVHLDGGAWCYDERDCAARSRTEKGSSRHLRRRYWPYSGPLDGSPAVNPAFSGFHRVNLNYCDGGSWTGDRADPVVGPSGERLYFRGRRVLDLLVDDLLAAGMRHATRVLWVGGSAGGPGALHAAGHVRARLGAQLEVFKVLIISGFFLLREPAPPAEGGVAPADGCAARPKAQASCQPWASKMRSMLRLHNSTAAASASCVAALGAAEAWRCFFPRHAAAHRDAPPPAPPPAPTPPAWPLYVINSALDSWQLVNVWRRFAPGRRRCRWDGARNCSAAAVRRDVLASNAMSAAFVADVRGALRARGDGAFVETCNEHIGGLSADAYQGYALGGATMRDALAAWWRAPADAPTAAHLRLPCAFDVPAAPDAPDAPVPRSRRAGASQHHQCNPSCRVSRRKRRLNQECPCEPP